MSRQIIGRIISVLIGAAVLYGLERGLGVKIYIAIPIAIVVYLALKAAIGQLLGVDDKAT
jgi:hypothetical protein